MMLDIAWRRWEEAGSDKKELDTKASIILAVNGVVLGLLINTLNAPNMPSEAKPWILVATAFLLFSSFACLFVLCTRTYDTINLDDLKMDLSSYFLSKESLSNEVYERLAEIVSTCKKNYDQMELGYFISLCTLVAGLTITSGALLVVYL